MQDYHFTGATNIEIQGPRVLELIERQTGFAKYNVIGFDGSVKIHDYRTKSLEALDAVLSGHDPVNFADAFSTPAEADISLPGEDQIFVQLHELNGSLDSDKVLWIAVGLRDRLPAHDYVLRKIEPFDGGTFAVVGFYQR